MISIIVPCYNAEKYIIQNLDSILRQTNNNFEVIYIDDGSQDNTKNLLKDISEKYDFISFHSISNSGAMNARRFGLSYAKYEYIAFVDIDDVIDINFISTFINFISDNDYEIIASNFNVFLNGKLHYKDNVTKGVYTPSKYLEILCTHSGWELCGKIYNKKLFSNILYPTQVSIGEDAAIFFQLVINSKLIKVIDERLYTYIHYPESSSNIKSMEKCRDGLKAAEFIKKILKESDLLEKKYLDSLILLFFCNSLNRGRLKKSDVYYSLIKKSINFNSIMNLSLYKRFIVICGFILMELNV